MQGKPLSALLQILRHHGVTRYATPELTLELSPPPVIGARQPALSPSEAEPTNTGGDGDEDDDLAGKDPRFLLEDLAEQEAAHRGRRQ